jgi:hypothetical protein
VHDDGHVNRTPPATRFTVPCRLRFEWKEGSTLRVRTLIVSDGGAYFVTEEGFGGGAEGARALSVPRDTANTFFLEQFAAEAEVWCGWIGRPYGETAGAGVALAFATRLPLTWT